MFEALAQIYVVSKKNTYALLYTDSFLNAIIKCTLRLTATPFELEKRWRQESLNTAFKRLCQFIRTNVEREIERDNFDMSVCSLFYPFLKVSFQAANL